MIEWKSFHDSPDRGYWDQTMLTDLLEGIDYPEILVTPGHWREKIPTEPDQLVLITSDEEGECPFWLLDNPVWKMTPNLHLAYRPDHAIPLGYTPHTRGNLLTLGYPDEKKGWTFSGQVTNARRHSCMEALRKLGPVTETDTFAAGLTPAQFIETLWRAEWVPCPAGNVRPETFRMWEALEAGAVPVLDATSPHGDQDYWPFVLGEHPFPVVWDWSRVGEILSDPAPLVEAAVWYSSYKARFKRDLWEAWGSFHGEPWIDPPKRITVIITASPIPSHPGYSILAETVDSVRQRLPGNRIIIAFDGPRIETPSYEEHIRRVAYHANLYWPEVDLHYSGVWKHQAGTIRDVLAKVYPDYATLLMLEHDTPLTGEIPFLRLTELLYENTFESIRFHHESAIPREHEYLMGDYHTDPLVRVRRTVQYSQRPHLAKLSFYKALMGRLSMDARTYVEDWIYSAAQRGEFKLGIYTPEGDIRRSYHLDGRAGAEKGEFWW